MFKKTLLTAAAALAITAGATTFSTPDANAGGGFSISFGGGHHGGHHYGHHGYGYGYGYGCHVKYYKKYKVKKWTHHGPVWVWVSKPVYSCH